jgi:hypothetical protein
MTDRDNTFDYHVFSSGLWNYGRTGTSFLQGDQRPTLAVSKLLDCHGSSPWAKCQNAITEFLVVQNMETLYFHIAIYNSLDMHSHIHTQP